MSQQRKIIAIFRTFVEKVFLPHLKTIQNAIQDWHKFNSLLLTPNLNISELQTYVESLPPVLPLSPKERKEFPLHLRNQQNMHLRPGSLENSSRLTRTSVGEKAKNIVFAIRQHQDTEKSTPNIKEQLQSKELSRIWMNPGGFRRTACRISVVQKLKTTALSVLDQLYRNC